MSWLGPLISAGASLIGNVMQNDAANSAANAQMAFQERMANTAHQREVDDLLKAGLNPILSVAKYGAPAPSGVMPNLVNPLGGVVSSALDTYRSEAEVEKKREETKRTKQVIKQNEPIEKVAEHASQGLDFMASGMTGAVRAVLDKFLGSSVAPGGLPTSSDVGGFFGKAADQVGRIASGVSQIPSKVSNFVSSASEPAATRSNEIGRGIRGVFEGDPRDVLKQIQRIRDPKEQKEAFGAWSEWVKNIKHSKPIRR